jgi:heme exporter protein A
MDTLITLQGVSKRFGLRFALRNISLEVPRGECLALLGLNGSGKTTLLRLLAGLSRQTAGQVTVGGWQLPREVDRVRAQFGLILHTPLVYDDLTARENLTFFAKLYGAKPDINGLLRQVGLEKRADDLVRGFSRGMLQRLALARAMLHKPAVFLLDEPYTGLDANGAAMLDHLFGQWKAEQRTVIASLHDIQQAQRLCQRVIILHQGRLLYVGPTPDDLPHLFHTLTQAKA